jgi:hypothetical protein
MKLYRFLVPLAPNNGLRYPDGTHGKFYHFVKEVAHGYTLYDSCVGMWRDPDTRIDMHEEMEPLEVACEPAVMKLIVDEFRARFPDQKCIMVTTLGEAEFFDGQGRDGPA